MNYNVMHPKITRKMRLLFTILLSLFLMPASWAQHQHTERCQTMYFQPAPRQFLPGGKVFEQQLREKIQENKLKRVESTYKIPVVVHIIHNGEAVGTGANISYEQILSQIDVLNEDFNRQNADASDTPPEFQPVAASADIEFALAQVTPNGLPITNEPGVNRFQGGRNSWSEFTFARDIQPQTQWDPTRYLNIWVANFGAGSLLGYAQFPTASGLTGLENEPDVANTDGVVVHYEHFGDFNRAPTVALQNGAPYNQGRTLTHELGHFFGVLHIWGDGGCGVDDFCNDTPEAANSYYDCPTTAESCGTPDMYQNFMDYTDNVCMNLFTADQVARMHSVLQTSPRRRELTSSTTGNVLAGLYPDFTANRTRICPGMEVQFQDLSEAYGDTEIIGVVWEFEGGSITSSTEPDPIVRYDQPGQYRVSLTVREVITEETLTREGYITVVDTQTAQNNLQEDVENFNAADWENPSGFWEVVSYSAYENGNRSLSVNNFTEDLRAEQDISLWTPLLNIQTPGVVALSFDLAYGYRGSEDRADSLEISYSTDCGGTFTTAWKKGGQELATRNTSAYLRPRAGDWQPVTVYMDASAGDFLQIRLRNVASYGNAIYVDNLNVEFLGNVDLPVADFELGYPLALTDEEIPFYDLSENLVLSRTWAFENGNPASSEAETPVVRFTTRGQANVSLTVRNPSGENVARKVDYLTVKHGFKFEEHMTDATPTALEANGGYLAGHNDTGDLAKAEFFDTEMTVFAADFDFAVAERCRCASVFLCLGGERRRYTRRRAGGGSNSSGRHSKIY